MPTRNALTPTPAPWVVMQDAQGWHIADENCLPIAMVALQLSRHREQANAKLISAVHDLADAAKTAYCAIQRPDNLVLAAMALNEIQNALAKAGVK